MHYFQNKSATPPQLSRRLLLCALSAWGLDTHAATSPSKSSPSLPYLLVCLPPALRFEPPVVPVQPVALDRVALGPPHPSGIVEEIASTNQLAAVAVAPHPASSPPSPSPSPTLAPSPADAELAPAPPPAATPPAAQAAPETILPDDTPRQIRPQDVLMYFRFPQGQPPSSATYQQK